MKPIPSTSVRPVPKSWPTGALDVVVGSALRDGAELLLVLADGSRDGLVGDADDVDVEVLVDVDELVEDESLFVCEADLVAELGFVELDLLEGAALAEESVDGICGFTFGLDLDNSRPTATPTTITSAVATIAIALMRELEDSPIFFRAVMNVIIPELCPMLKVG